MSLVSIRGAITVTENERNAMLEATERLLQSIIDANKISINHIVQIHFSCTRDLDAVYPAVAARKLGITQAALMCFQEMYVVGSLEKCIRVDMLVDETRLCAQDVKHQYLEKASQLRPDLIKES